MLVHLLKRLGVCGARRQRQRRGQGIRTQENAYAGAVCLSACCPAEVLEEGEQPAADSEELQHGDGHIRTNVLGYLVKPVEPVAEAPNAGAIDVGEAGVGGHVEEDVGGLLKLRAQQGVLDAHAARPK